MGSLQVAGNAHRDDEPKATASCCSLHALSGWEIRDANPKGIPSLSPGLRGTSYPGSTTSEGEFNPNGVVACRVDKRCNPVGVGRIPIGPPKVARSSQPWADGHNLVGIENACKAPASWTHSKRFAKFRDLESGATAFGVRGACSRFCRRFMERVSRRPLVVLPGCIS